MSKGMISIIWLVSTNLWVICWQTAGTFETKWKKDLFSFLGHFFLITWILAIIALLFHPDNTSEPGDPEPPEPRI